MHTLTDNRLAALCGMTANNLRMTYKKNPDPTKQRVYEFLRMGAEAWLEKQEKQTKNKELVQFLQNMQPLESFANIQNPVEYVNNLRKGRAIATID